jgi:hypothetical protein
VGRGREGRGKGIPEVYYANPLPPLSFIVTGIPDEYWEEGARGNKKSSADLKLFVKKTFFHSFIFLKSTGIHHNDTFYTTVIYCIYTE